MRRALIVLGLIATVSLACGGPSDREIQQAFETARQAMRRGAIDEALSSIDRVQPSLDAMPGSLPAHESRLLRAEVLIGKPDLERASTLLHQQLPDTDTLAGLRARDRYVRARLQVARGELADALITADAAQSLAADADGVRVDAGILAGQILFRLGRPDEAGARLKAAAASAEDHDDRYRQVLALNNLGMGAVVRGRFGEALPWFEQVLAFDELAGTSVYATAMNNAGLCYARLGDFERAVATQKRAVALHESRGAAAPLEQALGELGSTYVLIEDLARGVPYLTRALAVAALAGLHADAAR